MIEVLRPGPFTTIQDLGRPGWAHLGVPRSGAADDPSLRLANRLVGNPEDLAALETTVSGPRLRFEEDCAVAVTGAESRVRLDRRECELNVRIEVRAGETLSIGAARVGLRNYVAFGGGIHAPRTLGSSSHDVLTKLGPPPLVAGDRLRLGKQPRAALPLAATPMGPPEAEPSLPLALGPRDDWFPDSTIELLAAASFTVGGESNRIGLRLDGPPLLRADDRELLSEALMPGALQVPPNGAPILMLVDHPTTGGYPVIGQIDSDNLAIAAQLRPGQIVRFAPWRID
jgi:biotin-dependent carboxylase-like uncharacterized protein